VRVVGRHLLFIEVDEIPNDDAWYWDEVESEIPDAPFIYDVRAVEVASPDPEAQAQKRATLFGIEVERVDGQPHIQLGTRTIRFAHGDINKMRVVDLKAARWTRRRWRSTESRLTCTYPAAAAGRRHSTQTDAPQGTPSILGSGPG